MPSFNKIGPSFWRKRVYKFFTIYGYGGHLGHVTWIFYIHNNSPSLKMLHIKFGFDWLSGFMKEEVSYYGNIPVYCPRGRDRWAPGAQFFPESLIFSPTVHFQQEFPFKKTFYSFPHSNA